jgi:glycosyltransferase involved in cell wall biosynthesis
VYRSLRSGSRLLPPFADLLFRRVARRIVVNNPTIAASLRTRGVAPERIVVIPNGIDLDRFRPLAERAEAREALGLARDAPVVGFVGRMIPDKGLGRLVDAVARLAARVGGLSLLAVGDGPDRARFQPVAAAALGHARAVFTGSRSDPERMYPLMDVLAFPSTYSEGSPNVLLEAMACAVPVVANRLPQTEAMIQQSRTGLLVDARDPQTLAEAVAGLLHDPDRATSIAAAARRFVERHHDLAETVRRTERLYQGLAEASRCTRS